MEILYCDKWWLHRKEPTGILDLSTAEKRHETGKNYTAVLCEDNIVEYVIEVSAKSIIVRFMNDDINVYLTYIFQRKSEDNIFLSSAYYYKYGNGGDKETELITYRFTENGELYMEKDDLISDEVEEKESVVDVSGNWDKFPNFGKYDHLIEEERE